MRDIISDLALAVAVIIGAALLFVGASGLPPPRFEPMGSAALPRILASLLVLFAVILVGRALHRYFRVTRSELSKAPLLPVEKDATVTSDSADAGNTPTSTIRATLLFAALIGYVFALDRLQWSFVPVTTVFVALIGTLLSRPGLRPPILFFVYGLVLSYSVYAVFTRFLYVDL